MGCSGKPEISSAPARRISANRRPESESTAFESILDLHSLIERQYPTRFSKAEIQISLSNSFNETVSSRSPLLRRKSVRSKLLLNRLGPQCGRCSTGTSRTMAGATKRRTDQFRRRSSKSLLIFARIRAHEQGSPTTLAKVFYSWFLLWFCTRLRRMQISRR
jgi:hypothetical protein